MVHDQLLALLGHTVADAVDVQLLLIALVTPPPCCEQVGSGPCRARFSSHRWDGSHEMTLSSRVMVHRLAELLGQGALGPLDGDQLAFAHSHFHTGGR